MLIYTNYWTLKEDKYGVNNVLLDVFNTERVKEIKFLEVVTN